METTARPTILVPLDGSELAERAAPYARSLLPPDGELILLRAVRGPEEFADWWVVSTSDDEALASAQESAQRYLTSVASQLRETFPQVRTRVVAGDPATEILDLAETERVDTIVMTTHGRGATGRAIFGSVADRVARHGSRPTLLLRGDTSDREGTSLDLPTRILVPLDGLPLAEAALPVAARMAKQLSIPVLLVRVVDPDTLFGDVRISAPPESLKGIPDTDGMDRWARSKHAAAVYLASHVDRLRRLGVSAEFDVRTGRPALAIMDMQRPGDLVVLTSHGLGGIRRWLLGSIAEVLVRRAEAPVVLVRPESEQIDAAVLAASSQMWSPSSSLEWRVDQIMSSPVIVAVRETPLVDLVTAMLENRIGSVPIVDEQGRLVGIVTEADFIDGHRAAPLAEYQVRQVFKQSQNEETLATIVSAGERLTAADAMRRVDVTVTEQESIYAVVAGMLGGGVDDVPVVRNGIPVGIVTRHDLLKLLRPKQL